MCINELRRCTTGGILTMDYNHGQKGLEHFPFHCSLWLGICEWLTIRNNCKYGFTKVPSPSKQSWSPDTLKGFQTFLTSSTHHCPGSGGGGGRLLESPQIIGKWLSVPNTLPTIVVSPPVRAAVIQDTSCYSNWVKLQPHDPYWGLLLP